MTRVFKPPFSEADQSFLKKALQQPVTIAFPTETFYALGGNALLSELTERIFFAKHRSSDKPMLTLLTPDWLRRWADLSRTELAPIIKNFWPGPLTLILPASAQAPVHLTGPNHSIAVRYSNSALVQELIDLGECPLIGTSANRSGMPALNEPEQVLKQLGDALDILIDGGKSPGGLPSTILNLTTDTIRIEREGMIPKARLLECLCDSERGVIPPPSL